MLISKVLGHICKVIVKVVKLQILSAVNIFFEDMASSRAVAISSLHFVLIKYLYRSILANSVRLKYKPLGLL